MLYMHKNTVFKYLYLPLLFLFALPCGLALTEFSLLITGVIIAWYTARFGLKYTFSGLLPLFAVGYFLNGLPLACLLCAHTLSAFIIGLFLRKGEKFSAMLITGTLAEVTVLTGYTLYVCNIMRFKPADLLFGESLRQFSDIIATSGQFDADTVSAIQKFILYFSDTLQGFLPLFYLSTALLYVYVVFAVTRFCLKKQNHMINTMPYFYELWLPGSISGIFVIIFLFSIFSNSLILSNIVSFVFLLHVVCGLSVADSFLRKKSIPPGLRALIIAALIAIVSFLGGIFTSILCCIGMSRDARSIRK